MATEVVPSNDAIEINFEWSFKPIFMFMKIWGIDFDGIQPSQTIYRKILIKVCFFIWFVFNVFSWYDFSNALQSTSDLSQLYDTKGSKWGLEIEKIESFCFSVIIHLLLLVIPDKKMVWQLINQIEHQFGFKNQVYRRFRILSLTSVLCVNFLVKLCSVLVWISNIQLIHFRNRFFSLGSLLCWSLPIPLKKCIHLWGTS